ncbi:TetR/AcrR family transcriptional regulator [Aeromicrobium sp.]|uniref:TetR/AcrR family transcriptional regulator n=1 Tax=Aeromicrobium sp. TaxID=1871063 RepID=UPI001994A174|nr:TetR/AcrR family transcriptional regulator [Aeromicrobium sp.]MBC7630973.1 TetR/AcrR family transcriptional regulator [Aeromicrobium sp.]
MLGRKEQIIVRAAELFDTHGYHAASMEELAAAVGVAKPTLYHYFKSKNDILYAIHEEFIDLLISAHEARVAARPDISVDDRLLAIMHDILNLMGTHRGHVRVFFECHRSLRADQQLSIRAKRDAYTKMVVGVLEQGKADGEFFRAPDIAALALFGMCNWAYQWYDASGARSPADFADEFWQILLCGISSPPGRRRSPCTGVPSTADLAQPCCPHPASCVGRARGSRPVGREGETPVAGTTLQ